MNNIDAASFQEAAAGLTRIAVFCSPADFHHTAAMLAAARLGINHAALTLLAMRDPHRAQTLLDTTRFALDVAHAEP